MCLESSVILYHNLNTSEINLELNLIHWNFGPPPCILNKIKIKHQAIAKYFISYSNNIGSQKINNRHNGHVSVSYRVNSGSMSCRTSQVQAWSVPVTFYLHQLTLLFSLLVLSPWRPAYNKILRLNTLNNKILHASLDQF